MGFFGLFGNSKRKQELLNLQRVVMPDYPDRLVMSEKQLIAAAESAAADDLRIINDCVALVQKTMNPDVFFMRLDLLIEKSEHLAKLEPFVSFSGASPTAAYDEVKRNRNYCIHLFLERYYAAVHEKAEGMKTAKGRANQYKKFYDSLQEYYPQMSKAHISFVEESIQDK